MARGGTKKKLCELASVQGGPNTQVADTKRDRTKRDPSPNEIIFVNFDMCFVELRSNNYIPLSVICVDLGLGNT